MMAFCAFPACSEGFGPPTLAKTTSWLCRSYPAHGQKGGSERALTDMTVPLYALIAIHDHKMYSKQCSGSMWST